MEVQELIFAVHPGMTDHLRTMNTCTSVKKKKKLAHVSEFKKGVQWVYGVCQVCIDWGKSNQRLNLNWERVKWLILKLNRVGAEGGEREYMYY